MAGHVFSALSVLVLASGILAEKWWENTVIYQVYPLSFYDSNGDGIGDLRGIEEKASYLSELGVGAVWLNPFYKSPKVDNGYDISDFRDIDPQYGTMDDFERMLRTFRDKYGIEIIIDFVPNHTSDQHEWFKKSVKKEGKYTDYYIWKDPIGWENGKPIPPNKWDLFQFWLEKGVKGFRIDAVPFIFEDEDLTDEAFYGEETQSLPEAYELVEDMRAFVDEYGEEHNVDIMLMTEACVKPDMVLKYFGTPESPGAHIPSISCSSLISGNKRTLVGLITLLPAIWEV
ncbi:maltase 1 [Bemisia tabaci]|uniref:maltase 1 n=1 Tax=Bemisia tabaci TaxID=7038 RepID=UPI003B28D1AB